MSQPHELFKESLVIVRQSWADGKYTPKDYLYLLVLAHTGPTDGFTIESIPAFCQEWNLTQDQFEEGTTALIREGILEETIVSSPDLTEEPPSSDLPASG